MEYMLVYLEPAEAFAERTDPVAGPPRMAAWSAYMGAMGAAGVMRGGNALQGPHTATTVRMPGGKRQVQDGPFADTREHLGGYVVIDVPTLDDALVWASRAPCNANGATQVIPVADMSAHMPKR
jgi:hypothetical protein